MPLQSYMLEGRDIVQRDFLHMTSVEIFAKQRACNEVESFWCNDVYEGSCLILDRLLELL